MKESFLKLKLFLLGEFCISINNKVAKRSATELDFSYWESKYLVNKDHVPVFLSEYMTMILNTGTPSVPERLHFLFPSTIPFLSWYLFSPPFVFTSLLTFLSPFFPQTGKKWEGEWEGKEKGQERKRKKGKRRKAKWKGGKGDVKRR